MRSGDAVVRTELWTGRMLIPLCYSVVRTEQNTVSYSNKVLCMFSRSSLTTIEMIKHHSLIRIDFALDTAVSGSDLIITMRGMWKHQLEMIFDHFCVILDKTSQAVFVPWPNFEKKKTMKHKEWIAIGFLKKCLSFVCNPPKFQSWQKIREHQTLE